MRGIGKMNLKHLGLFCDGLNALPESIKNNGVHMKSISDPSCGTIGCHAGLISMVDVFELKKLYTLSGYHYRGWANALAGFLGFSHNRKKLQKWAYNHPRLWKIDYTKVGFDRFFHNEIFMFSCPTAFNRLNPYFSHQVIINKWNEVYHLCKAEVEAGVIENNHTDKNNLILTTILKEPLKELVI